jgi:DinB superfamily
MRLPEYLVSQFTVVNDNLQEIAGDLTPDELVTRALPSTNLIGFDLWHIARTQDWAAQTMARGVSEVIEDARWQSLGSPSRTGIGVGMTEAEADTLARSIALPNLLAYADTVHQTIVTWLATLSDDDLDAQPDVPAHIARHSSYLSDVMRAEVPWMYQQPPMWRCLSPGLGHVREHLAQIELLKHQLRLRA